MILEQLEAVICHTYHNLEKNQNTLEQILSC